MTYTNDFKPSVIENALWSADRLPWDSSALSYIELIWQFVPSNIWTNESEG